MEIELVSKTIGVNSYSKLNQEEIIAAVARHGVIKEDNGRLVKYLMDNAHWSPLQHISFSFKVKTSRAISAQIFRHRSLHFQETSQRYQRIQDIEGIELREEHKTNRQSSTDIVGNIVINEDGWEFIGNHNHKSYNAIVKASDALVRIQEAYNELVESGLAKECARMILPMSSSTTIHITGSLRDLLAFMNVRCDEHTQKEARDIATGIGECLEKELPNVFKKIDWRKGFFM